MVTISNGEKTFRVTAGAVNVYKSMGFHVVEKEVKDIHRGYEEVEVSKGYEKEQISSNSDEEENIDNVNDEENKFIEELLEKPLSQWNNEEVKEFVKIKNIDTSGAQKVSQVRGIIKAYLEEQSKNV